jgi:hypothetical protein
MAVTLDVPNWYKTIREAESIVPQAERYRTWLDGLYKLFLQTLPRLREEIEEAKIRLDVYKKYNDTELINIEEGHLREIYETLASIEPVIKYGTEEQEIQTRLQIAKLQRAKAEADKIPVSIAALEKQLEETGKFYQEFTGLQKETSQYAGKQ